MQKISYVNEHVVWKIEVFNQHSILVELRDTMSFKTEWKIFSLDEEHCIQTIKLANNSWWHSIAQTKNSLIFLHELKQGKNPEITGLKIISINPYTIKSLENNKLIEVTAEHYCVVDHNGVIQKVCFEQYNIPPKIVNPVIYPEKSTFFSQFTEIICNQTGITPSLECEYIERKNHLVIGYYQKIKNDCFNYHLLILDLNGKIIFSEVLQKELKGKINGHFFSLGNKIIFTKNKSEIEIIHLP